MENINYIHNTYSIYIFYDYNQNSLEENEQKT